MMMINSERYKLSTFILLLLGVANTHAQTIKGNVYGGGELALVTEDTDVSIKSGTVDGDVYGGGALATVEGDTKVWLTGGMVNSVYGGGLGSKIGVGDATEDVEAVVGGHTLVTLNGSVVNGNIFGCNNINGTPLGHAKVHVLSTTPRDGFEYDVPAVYGGGNLAAYNPNLDPAHGGDAEQYAEVIVENCDNSIEYVYGGGNAAPVPATQVTIKGADAIDNAFAGGNGAGDGNPGADIGYLGYYGRGGATEYGTGVASIHIFGGTIHHVYGGSNTLGYIKDHAEVNVEAEGTCTMDIAELYGGGKKAPGKAATINIACTGEGKIDNVYGGAHMADLTGDIELNIRGGQIGNVFGGNHESGIIDGAITINLDWNEGVGACGINSLNNIYGGGNLAPYTTPDGKEGPTVNLIRGTVENRVFGGGLGTTAVVTGNPLVKLNGATVQHDIYGGGDAADVIGTAGVKVDRGTVETVYGGGNAADVTNTDVIINGGVTQMAFAGGHGDKDAVDGEGNPAPTEANVTGNAHVTIHGGTVERVFAGSNSKGSIEGEQKVTVLKNGEAQAELHITEIYGGGNQADGKAGIFEIGCTGGEGEGIGDIFGGAREADILGDVAFTIQGGNIDRIFGGNNISGNVTGSIQVNIVEDRDTYDCGLNVNYVYGGGQDASYTPATPGAYPEVNILSGSIAQDVFGGGLGVTAVVTGNPSVNILGGSVVHNVYGGGALANVIGNTTVNLTGGAVGGAYGGALGQLADAGVAAIETIVSGNTLVTLQGTQVTDAGIFGCNNLNGSPRGHAKVHVLSTTTRDGFEYAVPAVYGGGNLSAYEPADASDYAEVLIENCDNSIEYVYGGGNAAPVPATRVTITGANAINYAFAGGNGAGAGNPGADIGYLDYHSLGSTTQYGTGQASIIVTGGTVHNVYGGSNTLGYIRGGTMVSVQDGDGACLLSVGNVFGGGNEADIDCDVVLDLDCSEGGAVLYAGANDANVEGNIILNIHSGTYGKVFCGNNVGGNIYGNLTVNIDETGCWPVMIGELYACGNLAPYSVYGYDAEGVVQTEGTRRYNDPEINLISFTRIGKVFGGGYGQTAVLYGNTHVNVETIKGKFAGQTVTPSFVLDADDIRRERPQAESLAYGITSTDGTNIVIPDTVGSIGYIYGGGNAGAIYGNTVVNIGTEERNRHIGGSDTTTEYDVAVTITGNVFGGGNEAIVSGDTNVTIGK